MRQKEVWLIVIIALLCMQPLYKRFFNSTEHLPQKNPIISPNEKKKEERRLLETHQVNSPRLTFFRSNLPSVEEKETPGVSEAAAGESYNAETYNNSSEREQWEMFIRDLAAQNLPIDMETLGRMKQYFVDNNDMPGYQSLIVSLPNTYEMKNELITDLAFSYQEQGQVHEALNVIEAINNRDNNLRFHYFKSDLYLGAGNWQVAINELFEASKISEEPFQYERLAEIYQDEGDNTTAAYYFKRADTLKSIMYHDDL